MTTVESLLKSNSVKFHLCVCVIYMTFILLGGGIID